MNEMADILKVIYVSEVRAVQTYDLKTQKDEFLVKYLYPRIFDSLGVADSVFYTSYDYYEGLPDKMEALMDTVILRISEMPLDTIQAPKDNDKSLDDKYRDITDLENFKRRQKNARLDPNR